MKVVEHPTFLNSHEFIHTEGTLNVKNEVNEAKLVVVTEQLYVCVKLVTGDPTGLIVPPEQVPSG